MPAPQIILELIDRFERNLDDYKSGVYNETQVRREFIDPFFEALGWDVNNKEGNAEAYKDAVKVSGVTKAPDYSFRIGGQRKFFVEAKKPSVNIKDAPAAAFQVRRYAWSGKLPLSIVTDFDELAVYDCRIKPDQNDKADKARIKYYTYRQYAEKWDEIAAIFSKDAILKGSFDKYAESNKTKRGTAEVDSAFLAEIESWREMLARNIALRNSLTVRELNDSVQRIIDGVIFLRIAEDRGIEDYGALRGIVNGNNTYGRLQELFYKADDRYNSGLFHFRHEKDEAEPPDKLTTTLSIDDKPLKDILKTLYYPDSPYEFAVLPADILGQVYEQFLGKVIRLTSDHRAVVEDKPEVKKAGGVFYTPTYIVEYIVKNTVGKLLEGKTPKKAGSLRILDPACGSGSFLLGAYQSLLDWHLKWYSENEPRKWAKAKRPALYQGQGGAWHLTTAERKRILLNNIYGVDIDSQAVEVTKLSLLLKVLEDETDETLNRQRKLFHERALPNLGGNIKCGNSLIGPDFYDGKQMNMLATEEAQRVNVFDWQAEFPEIFKAGGFDAVIGNPPYGAYLYQEDKNYLTKKYPNQTYQLDSYLLFIERSVKNLLIKKGLFGMIMPNPWLTNLTQTKFRNFVTHNTKIIEIVHFKQKVFNKVTVDTEIVILQNQGNIDDKTNVLIVTSIEEFINGSNKNGIKSILHEQRKWCNLNGGVINIFLEKNEEDLARKCIYNNIPLKNICLTNVGIKPYQIGKGTPPQNKDIVENRIFDSSERISSEYRQYLRGKDINKYIIAPLEERFIKFGPWIAEPRPAIDFSAEEKILMRQTGDSLIATLDTNRYLCLNNLHVIINRNNNYNIRYLLGLLNSNLLNWYYHTLNPEVGEALAEIKKSNVENLPIRNIAFDNAAEKKKHDWMVTLVEQMLALHKQLTETKTGQEQTLIQRQIDATDQQIDKLVYELYELTPEEIKIVENA
jgi:type I restriction-modification system DNA methylase subunit/predicted type IV restriction endonuclease